MNIDKLTKKSIVMLILGVTVFLITIVGSAYAFYQGNSTISFNNSNQSLTIPAKCTFSAYQNYSLGDCTLTYTTLTGASATGTTGNMNDKYIEPKELVPRDDNNNIITDDYEIENYYYGKQVAKSTCGYTVQLIGAGCTCTYNIDLYSESNNPLRGIDFDISITEYKNGTSETIDGTVPDTSLSSRIWMGVIEGGNTINYKFDFFALSSRVPTDISIEHNYYSFKFETNDLYCYKN